MELPFILTKDEKQHLVGGFAVLAAGALLLWLRPYIGDGLTLALGSAITAGGVEWYQDIRNEGDPSWLDAMISAGPGVGAGLVWHVLVALA